MSLRRYRTPEREEPILGSDGTAIHANRIAVITGGTYELQYWTSKEGSEEVYEQLQVGLGWLRPRSSLGLSVVSRTQHPTQAPMRRVGR